MKTKTIEIQQRRRCTVGTPGGKYDSEEFFVGLSADLEDGDDLVSSLATLSMKARDFLSRQIEIATKAPQAEFKALVASREEAVAPASQVERPPVQQTYTAKPILGQCGTCGENITNQKTMDFAKQYNRPPRCYSCGMKVKAANAAGQQAGR